jgi:hypothetical protein
MELRFEHGGAIVNCKALPRRPAARLSLGRPLPTLFSHDPLADAIEGANHRAPQLNQKAPMTWRNR